MKNAVGLWLRPEVYVAISERLSKADDQHMLVTTLRTLAGVNTLDSSSSLPIHHGKTTTTKSSSISSRRSTGGSTVVAS